MSDFFSDKQNSDIVLSSRIRLARNIDNVPFPHMLDDKASEKVMSDVSSAFIGGAKNSVENFNTIKLKDVDNLNRLSLIERHVISKELAKNYERSGLIVSKDEHVSIMINEEDHIRIQVIYPGLKLKEAFEEASKYDDIIEDKIDYAYNSGLGYLTSCPTNVGTGMRASIMLHLPALSISKNINSVLNTVSQVGMTIRGIYGEGSNVMGNMYQISNQTTLGLSEEEIINNLTAVVIKIIDQEKKTRELILKNQHGELEDEIYRSLGILRYARLLTSSESLNLLSNVRMGVEMGIIQNVDINKINKLLFDVQPGTLQLHEGKELDAKGRDLARAKIVRNALSEEV